MEEYVNGYINFCKRKATSIVKNNNESNPLDVIKEMFSEINKHPLIKMHSKFRLLDPSLVDNKISTKEEALSFIAQI